MPSSFVSHAQGCRIIFQKGDYNTDQEIRFFYQFQVPHVVRGMPDKLELVKRTSEYLTVNQSSLNTQSLGLKAIIKKNINLSDSYYLESCTKVYVLSVVCLESDLYHMLITKKL